MRTAAGIGILIFLFLLCIIPAAVTITVSLVTPPRSQNNHIGRINHFIILISCGFHFALYALLHRLFFHNFNFLATAKRVLSFQYTY